MGITIITPMRHRFWKFSNLHLFWLNSHPGRACLVLRACRSAAFLDHDAKKGCEFNQKRCELKNFLDSFKVLGYNWINLLMRTQQQQKKTSTIAVPFHCLQWSSSWLLRSHLAIGSLVFQNGQWHFGLLYHYRDGLAKCCYKFLNAQFRLLFVLWGQLLNMSDNNHVRLSWQLKENPKIPIQSTTSIQSGVFVGVCPR
jgi:hypothetical protein